MIWGQPTNIYVSNGHAVQFYVHNHIGTFHTSSLLTIGIQLPETPTERPDIRAYYRARVTYGSYRSEQFECRFYIDPDTLQWYPINSLDKISMSQCARYAIVSILDSQELIGIAVRMMMGQYWEEA